MNYDTLPQPDAPTTKHSGKVRDCIQITQSISSMADKVRTVLESVGVNALGSRGMDFVEGPSRVDEPPVAPGDLAELEDKLQRLNQQMDCLLVEAEHLHKL